MQVRVLEYKASQSHRRQPTRELHACAWDRKRNGGEREGERDGSIPSFVVSVYFLRVDRLVTPSSVVAPAAAALVLLWLQLFVLW